MRARRPNVRWSSRAICGVARCARSYDSPAAQLVALYRYRLDRLLNMRKRAIVALALCGLGSPAVSLRAQARASEHVRRDSVLVLEPIHTTAMPEVRWPNHAVLRAANRAARDSLLRELEAARQRWAHRSAQNVTYRLREPCHCIFSTASLADVVVSARGDSVIDVRSVGTAPTLTDPFTFQQRSVAYLFARAERAILADADEIVVLFDPVFGIPRRIWVDPNQGATDDEFEMVITDIAAGP